MLDQGTPALEDAPMMRTGSRAIALTAICSLVLVACSGDDPAGDPTPTTRATPHGRIQLTGLRVEQPKRWSPSGENWEMRLTWKVPPGSPPIDHFSVVRDGISMSESIEEPAYRDTTAVPGRRYRYAVVGVGADGKVTRPASVAVRTMAPPISQARLDGGFQVRMTVNAWDNLTDTPDALDLAFTFQPTCAKGPCNVRWNVNGRGANGTLIRRGAVYEGAVDGSLYINSCSGDRVNEDIDVRLTVTAAVAYEGQWRAKAIEGTVEEQMTAPGCLLAQVSWDVRGRDPYI
jgi:hypothetical protein